MKSLINRFIQFIYENFISSIIGEVNNLRLRLESVTIQNNNILSDKLQTHLNLLSTGFDTGIGKIAEQIKTEAERAYNKSVKPALLVFDNIIINMAAVETLKIEGTLDSLNNVVTLTITADKHKVKKQIDMFKIKELFGQEISDLYEKGKGYAADFLAYQVKSKYDQARTQTPFDFFGAVMKEYNFRTAHVIQGANVINQEYLENMFLNAYIAIVRYKMEQDAKIVEVPAPINDNLPDTNIIEFTGNTAEADKE